MRRARCRYGESRSARYASDAGSGTRCAVAGVEELEEDVGHADVREGAAERLGAQVEGPLVARAGVDVDRAQPRRASACPGTIRTGSQASQRSHTSGIS